MKYCILAALVLTLAGCAAPAPTQLSTTFDKPRPVAVRKIDIDNFASSKTTRPNDGVYFTGWLPISDAAVAPSFHEAFTQKLKGSLKATGTGTVELQVAIIEAGFFMDSHASDSVVFVGIAAAFREREYKCNAILNIKVNGKSERREFDNVQISNRTYGDIEDKRNFISTCHDKLAQKVADYISATQ